MRLSDFYSRIAPFLLGEASHPQAVESLYGQHAPSPDADRLAIYGRFCRLHRHETIEGVFSTLQKCLTRQLGEECWSSLIAAYFRAHPMHHFELNHNAAAFPQFLQTADLPSLLGNRRSWRTSSGGSGRPLLRKMTRRTGTSTGVRCGCIARWSCDPTSTTLWAGWMTATRMLDRWSPNEKRRWCCFGAVARWQRVEIG